jgi:hypothetical protein
MQQFVFEPQLTAPTSCVSPKLSTSTADLIGKATTVPTTTTLAATIETLDMEDILAEFFFLKFECGYLNKLLETALNAMCLYES